MSTIEEEPIPLPLLAIENLPSDQLTSMPSEQNSSIQLVAAEMAILTKDTNDNAVEEKNETDDAAVSNEMKDLTVKSVSGNEQDVNVNEENADKDNVIADDPDVVGEKKDARDNPADVLVLSEDEEQPREKVKGWKYLEDDEVMQPGLLERPVIIEGKRRRSTVTRFQIEIGTPSATKSALPMGSGTPLSEASHFTSVVCHHTAEELKPLHRLLFGNAGKVASIKKDVRKFNGFPFSKDSAEYKKRHRLILNLKKNQYALILNAFKHFYTPKDKKDRQDYATHLLDILLCPPKLVDIQDSKTPKRGSSKTPVTSRKRQSSGSIEPEAKRSKKSEKNAGRGRSFAGGDSNDMDTSQGSQQNVEDNSDGENNDPTMEELKKACSDIIKDADLNKLTTKQVIEEVALVFPNMDLGKKRGEIKNIIKNVVMSLPAVSSSSS